jgi:hypothetical protein
VNDSDQAFVIPFTIPIRHSHSLSMLAAHSLHAGIRINSGGVAIVNVTAEPMTIRKIWKLLPRRRR